MKRLGNRSRRKRQSGNVMIELALLSTVLILVLSGVTGFARVFSVASLAQGAAEAGVSYGTLAPANSNDLTGMQNAALADTGNYAGATATASQYCTCSIGGAQVACPATCAGGSGQEYVKVSVTIPYLSVFNNPMIPNPINVTQAAMARVQ